MLNAAIIGLGRWGQRLVTSVQDPAVRASDAVRFVRAATRTPAKAAEFAARHNLRLGSEIQSILEDPAVQAVMLATPHTQHAEQIIAAARAGKHVFVEKPLTLLASDAQRAAAACEAAGVVLAAGHNRRFLPAMHDLKALIASGELGKILHVEGNFSGSFGFVYKTGMWRADPAESPAGGMTAMGIHVIDAFIHLCGPIETVLTQSFRQVVQSDLDDTTSVLLRFAGGSSGYLGTLTTTARLWRIQLFGTKGWAHMRDQETLDICAVDQQPVTRSYPPLDIERAELEAFARAVERGSTYPVPPAEAVHGVAVLEAISESAAADGRPIRVM